MLVNLIQPYINQSTITHKYNHLVQFLLDSNLMVMFGLELSQ